MYWWWLRSPGNNSNNAANVNNDGNVNNNVNNDNEAVRPVVCLRILSKCLKPSSELRRPVPGEKESDSYPERRFGVNTYRRWRGTPYSLLRL